MASLNKVLLIGNLTRDPEVRMLPSGRSVCKFGLAVNRSFKDAEGNSKDETTFVDVESFGPSGEALARFFNKGKPIFVEGRLKLDQWESQTGEKRSKLLVVLDNWQFVGSKRDNDEAQTRYLQSVGEGSNPTLTADSQVQQPPQVAPAAPPEQEQTESPAPDKTESAADPDLNEDVPF